MNKKLAIGYVAMAAWMAVIFVLSSEGHDTSSGRSDAIVHTLQSAGLGFAPVDVLTFITRKAAHTVAYLLLGILAYRAVRQHGLLARRVAMIAIAIVVVYATSDEVHQLFVPGRSGEPRDVLIDSTAGAVGVAASYFIYRKHRLQKSQR